MSQKEKHVCALNIIPRSGLPVLAPNAATRTRFVRLIRQVIILSPKNPRTKLRFRSAESIATEVRRHMKDSKVSIHPYSMLAMYRDIAMHITWVIYFYIGTLYLMFHRQRRINIMRFILYSLKPLLGLQVLCGFFMGYYDAAYDYIELRMRKIVKHYLLGYFIFDFLYVICPEIGYKDRFIFIFEALVHLLICVRLISINRYFRVLTLMLDLGESFHELLCLIFTAMRLTHFSAVVLYTVSNSRYMYGTLSNTSWVVLAGIPPDSDITGLRKYLLCMHKVCAMFLGPCSGMWNARNLDDMLIFTTTILLGMFYVAYVIGLVLQMTLSLRSSANLYNHMLYQLSYYCRVKKLPDNLKRRMKMYYVSRFRQNYFRENVILDTLSEHLKLELQLHNCRQLLRSSWLFYSLSATAIGQMIVQLRSLVFLPNDVIKEYKDMGNIYFIANGEVAVYTYEGTELYHLSDGDYFGEFSVLSNMGIYKAHNISMNLQFVAVYITELLILKQEVFMKYISKNSETLERIKQNAKLRDLINLEHLRKFSRTGDVLISRKLLSRNVKRKTNVKTILND